MGFYIRCYTTTRTPPQSDFGLCSRICFPKIQNTIPKHEIGVQSLRWFDFSDEFTGRSSRFPKTALATVSQGSCRPFCSPTPFSPSFLCQIKYHFLRKPFPTHKDPAMPVILTVPMTSFGTTVTALLSRQCSFLDRDLQEKRVVLCSRDPGQQSVLLAGEKGRLRHYSG